MIGRLLLLISGCNRYAAVMVSIHMNITSELDKKHTTRALLSYIVIKMSFCHVFK